MEKGEIRDRIPYEFRRQVVDCVHEALANDLPSFLGDYPLSTKNCVPHLIGDLINNRISSNLVSGPIQVHEFKRYCWKGKIIIDLTNRLTYSIMRSTRLSQIRKEKRERPHYLHTVCSVLNSGFSAPVKQLAFEGMVANWFDQDVIDEDYYRIFHGYLRASDGFNHCVIEYEATQHELTDINILFLDKDLAQVDCVTLSEFVKPDFAALTNVPPATTTSGKPETRRSDGLVALKVTQPEAAASPVRLRAAEKEV